MISIMSIYEYGGSTSTAQCCQCTRPVYFSLIFFLFSSHTATRHVRCKRVRARASDQGEDQRRRRHRTSSQPRNHPCRCRRRWRQRRGLLPACHAAGRAAAGRWSASAASAASRAWPRRRRGEGEEYVEAAREMVRRPDGGPARWFSPLECGGGGGRLPGAPTMLYLPGMSLSLKKKKRKIISFF